MLCVKFLSTRLARVLIIALVLGFALPAHQLHAAPAGQEAPTPEPLILGQYGFADLLNGESIAYELTVPETGSYLITAVDDTAASDFDLVVSDATGAVLYDDIFATSELALEAGAVTLEFFAAADSTLGFVVLGQLGAMSADESQPGKLLPGSVYVAEEVSEIQYAQFTVPETPYPQQVLIYLEAGEGDTFYASIEGEEAGFDSITTDSENLLHVWTHGDEFLIEVEPYERRSTLNLVIFLSGPPASMSVDTPLEGAIPTDATEMVYALELEAAYDPLALEVQTEGDAPVDLLLVDHLTEGDIYYGSDGEPVLEVPNLYPGIYYVFVQTDEPAAEEIPFTLTASGEAGRPLVALENGQPHSDEFLAGEETIVYSFDVTTPGALITASLTAGDPETDFDLYAGLRPGINTWSNYAYRADEILTFMAPVAGAYYLGVLSNGETGPFAVTVEEGEPTPALAANTLITGSVTGNSRTNYRLEVNEPNQMLSIMLVGPEDVDLDLIVNGFNEDGDIINSLGSYSSGSAEIVSDVLTEPGTYEIAVSAVYADEGGDYFIRANLEDPRAFGAQWAVDAVASTEYGEEDFGAQQTIGPSDTPYPGDYPTAWASLEADAGEEVLELFYAMPVVPYAIDIYETYNPGAITLIEAYDAATESWTVIWEGTPGAPEGDEASYRIFSPELSVPDFASDQLRITLDTTAVLGWNEIDAVQLFGRP